MDPVVWILITIAIVFPAIVFAGLYRVRVRKIPTSLFSSPQTENRTAQLVTLDLTLPLLSTWERSIRRMKLAPWLVFFLFGGTFWLVFLLNGDPTNILDPNQPFLKFLIPITVAMGLISFSTAKVVSRDHIKAYSISKGKRL